MAPTKWIFVKFYTDEPGYNDIGLYDTSYITSDVLCFSLLTIIVHFSVIIPLGYNDTKYSVPFSDVITGFDRIGH